MIKVSDIASIARAVQCSYPMTVPVEYYEGVHAGVEIIRLLVICLDSSQSVGVGMSNALHCVALNGKCKSCPYDVLSFNEKNALISRKAFKSMEVVDVWDGRI